MLVSIEGCRANATSIEAGNCFFGGEVPPTWLFRHDRATPWNRTRTSRASAERADLLRKSGALRPRYVPRSHHHRRLFVFHLAPSSPRRCRPAMSAVLGGPSIRLRCSQPRFGKRGSNSHFQGQSLAFCRLNDSRSLCREPGGIRTPTARVKAEYACPLRHGPEVDPQSQTFELLLHLLSFRGSGWS